MAGVACDPHGRRCGQFAPQMELRCPANGTEKWSSAGNHHGHGIVRLPLDGQIGAMGQCFKTSGGCQYLTDPVADVLEDADGRQGNESGGGKWVGIQNGCRAFLSNTPTLPPC